MKSLFRLQFDTIRASLSKTSLRLLRDVASWAIVISLATPARFAVAAPLAIAGPVAAASTESNDEFSKLMDLADQIKKLDASAAERVPLKAQADRLSEDLQLQIQAELAPFDAEYMVLKKKASDDKTEIDREKLDRLLTRAKPTLQKKQMLLNLAGEIGQPVMGVISDGAVDATGAEKLLAASLETANGPPDAIESETPARLHERIAGSILEHGHAFSTQYFTFSVALGFIAMAQMGTQSLGLSGQTDPNAFENWEKQTFNLMGAEGFAVFYGANHATLKLFKSMRSGVVPHDMLPAYMNYLGMTAGSVAQSLFSEIHADKDVWACVKPFYDSKIQPNPTACEKMRETWITKGKVLQYTPSVVSMLFSTALSSGVSGSLRAVANPDMLRPAPGASRFAHIKFKGAVLINKTKVGKFIAKAAKFVPGKLVGVGDFVMFLAMDTYVTQEPINRHWQNIKMNYLDANAWLNKNAGLHAEFFFPKDGSLQAIANAFDVEATTPLTAHTYLMDTYKKLQDSGWKQPAPTAACAPKEIKDGAKSDEANIKDKWIWQRWWIMHARSKSQEQLACEVQSRPADLLARYGEVNRDWRGVVMGPFSAAQNNWLTMLSQFTASYGASMKLATYLANKKYEVAYKNSLEKPDLSREALAKVIGSALAKEEGSTGAEQEQEGTEKANSTFLDNTWMPTPEMVDFVIAGLACGPDASLDPDRVKTWPVPKWFDTIYAAFARQIASPSYMTTPWGSSLHFIPPKLTNKSRAVCENVQNSFYDTLNIMTGNYLPTLSTRAAKVANPFTGPFTDENGKSYATLAEFVFENLDPEVYKPVGNYTGFPLWWANHLTRPITPVYENYSKVFDQLIQEKYFPLLFDRTYKFGCDANDDCSHSSNAYRVANGFFLSVEIEMRNYVRGMFSLYASTFTKKEASQNEKKAFMDLANGIISDIQTVSGDDLRGQDFEKKLAGADQSLKAMANLIETRLRARPSPENEFRLEMLAKFKEQITKLIGEEHGQIDLVKMWNFTGASTRGPVKRINTPTSANPLSRGGG